MAKTREELLEMLNDPEVVKRLEEDGVEFSEITVEDSDTLDTVTRKMNKQLSAMQKQFNKQLSSIKKEAVNEAMRPHKDKERAEILRFQESHPGMKNKDVVALMDPLYAQGKSLEEAYQIGCKALGLDETTGEAPSTDKVDPEADDKKSKPDKPEKKTSVKSTIPDDPDTDLPEKQEAKSLKDIIKANMNSLDAEKGDPFKED